MFKLFDIISDSGNRDWEYLPEFCLLRVLEKIDGPISLVRFGAVTRHWHSMSNIFLDIRRPSSSSVPMLVIPSKKPKVKLFSLEAESKVSEFEFPKPYTARCWGSSYGWLATIDYYFTITLWNPFKNNISIDLPRLNITNQNIFDFCRRLQKVVLSDDPLLYPSSYALVVIYGVFGKLAVYQSVRNDWIHMDNQSPFQDVIFHKNWVYAIGSWKYNLVSFHINDVEDDGKPKLNILVAQGFGRPRSRPYDQAYLVKSSMGIFYSVHKRTVYDDKHIDFDDEDPYGTVHYRKEFKVFKLVLDDGNGDLLEKKEVENVDGDIVFVGDTTSLVISAFDFPQAQPNSIYYTDFGDIGIFHLNDKSFGKKYRIKYFHKYLRPFVWVSPPVQLDSTPSD